jgi:NAD(P)-dependent dehydrogenase (short-subunit alcohol dehydrogenase family)
MGDVGVGERVAIVTGGTYGIGRGITLTLAERGYRVVAFGLEARQLGSAAQIGIAGTRAALEARGLTADLLEADVSRVDDVQRVVDFAVSKYQRVDALVNNAGIHPTGTILDTSPETWDTAFRVNIGGMFLCARAVMPHMIGQGGGAIVNLGSGSGWGRAGLIAYASSKSAVYGFSAALARDHLHQHVRVNVVVPGGGPVTGMTEGRGDLAALAAQTVAGRNTTPEDVAHAVAYLLSDDALNVTGTILTVGCFLGQGGPAGSGASDRVHEFGR